MDTESKKALDDYKQKLSVKRGLTFERTHSSIIKTASSANLGAYEKIAENIKAAKDKLESLKFVPVNIEPNKELVTTQPSPQKAPVSNKYNAKTEPIVQRVISQNHKTYNSFVNAVYGELKSEKEAYQKTLSSQVRVPIPPTQSSELKKRVSILKTIGILQRQMDDQSNKLRR